MGQEQDTKTDDRAKATAYEAPKTMLWQQIEKILQHRQPVAAPVTVSSDKSESPSSREMVRWLLSALSSAPAKPPVLSRDLEALARVMGSIRRAVSENILTDEEAEAVVQYLADCFTRRRFDEVFSRITQPRSGAWFMVHSHAAAED